MAVLVGSPGLGKSRLIGEFARRCGDEARVVAAHCDQARGATFAPIADAVREILSIDAGAAADSMTAMVEAALPAKARIVRAMPNTPALIRAGATAICGNAQTDASDRGHALTLFESVGTTWEAASEDLLDAVTGLSGSGPAYVFLFLEALIDAGEAVGLPREAAEQLAIQTVYGAAKLAREAGSSPAELRERVSSPGGTTLAGLAALDASGFREIITRAVAAATRRSIELGEDS